MNEYRKVPVPEGSFVSTDAQHQALQEHIASCNQCKAAIEQTGRHMSGVIGTRTKMCGEYLKIVRMFASAELWDARTTHHPSAMDGESARSRQG